MYFLLNSYFPFDKFSMTFCFFCFVWPDDELNMRHVLNSLTRNYIQHKLKLLKGESNSALSLALRKELQDEHLKCLLEGSSCAVSSSNMAADPLLTSFIYNMPPVDDASKSVQPSSSTEASIAEESLDENMLERYVHDKLLLFFLLYYKWFICIVIVIIITIIMKLVLCCKI